MKKMPKKKAVKKAVTKSKMVAKGKRDVVAELKKKMAKLRTASDAKIREMEAELNRLRDENEYKNKQLASKDLEMEGYRKVTEEKIFQLEAKVKELEGRAG